MKNAGIFLFMFGGFLHFKSTSIWNIKNNGNANQERREKRVGGPTKGVGAWMVAMETTNKAWPFAPSHTGAKR